MTTRSRLASSVALAAMLALTAGCASNVKGPEGIWQGKLQVPGGELTVVFHVTKGDGGKLAVSLDSPDQGATGIAGSDVAFSGGKLTAKFPSIGGAIEATLQPGDSVLSGTWSQGPATLPLVMKRVDKVAEVKRPQEPTKPYPYGEEEVTFDNFAAAIKLAGTLTLPKSDGPFPAVVLISGSGPEDRDEKVFGHRPFLVLADYFTRQGIAVLRFDDRGVGKSTGDYAKATTADLATDALAAVEFLKTRKEIDPKHIGLLGHSEGGVIAPIVANQTADVAFVVLMAGTGVPGDSVLMLQSRLIAKAEGASDSAVAAGLKLERQMLDITMEEPDTAKAAAAMRKAITEAMATMSDSAKATLTQFSEAGMDAQIKAMLSPWFRYFLTYDPRPALRQLKVPVLAVVGGKDVQVAPKENLAAIEAALKEGGNKDYTVIELPGLNHLLQTATTGAVSEYAKTEETIAPSALKLFADWILARTRVSR